MFSGKKDTLRAFVSQYKVISGNSGAIPGKFSGINGKLTARKAQFFQEFQDIVIRAIINKCIIEPLLQGELKFCQLIVPE